MRQGRSLFKGAKALYLITDRAIAGIPLVEIVRQAVSAGVRTIQIREKELSKKELVREIISIKPLLVKYKVLLIINDYIDIALAVDAAGVHLGQDDMPIKEARKIMRNNKIIGISTHTLKQALDAQRAGADYIGFGPMFHTMTKDAGKPKGINALREIKRHIKIPVVAIGGIAIDNVSDVLNAGADAMAVASGILKGDIRDNVGKFLRAIKLTS
ncbi:MAG: thiamine phosphate synthase [Nitrospirae bacterium]|nr:thiamine phosphate synthase [Nitrospirota bacterium]